MPGIPMGYVVGNDSAISHIKQFSDGSEITMFNEIVAREFPHTSDYLDETVALLEKEIPWMQCMLSLTPASKYFPQKPILLCVRSKSVLHGISVFQVQRI